MERRTLVDPATGTIVVIPSRRLSRAMAGYQRSASASLADALRGSPGELQIQRVACPRNHHNLQREVVGFGRPLRLYSGPNMAARFPLNSICSASPPWFAV